MLKPEYSGSAWSIAWLRLPSLVIRIQGCQNQVQTGQCVPWGSISTTHAISSSINDKNVDLCLMFHKTYWARQGLSGAPGSIPYHPAWTGAWTALDYFTVSCTALTAGNLPDVRAVQVIVGGFWKPVDIPIAIAILQCIAAYPESAVGRVFPIYIKTRQSHIGDYVPYPKWQSDGSDQNCAVVGNRPPHHNDVIMSAMASQITVISIVCSIVCLSAEQWKHQSSAPRAFVRGINGDRWIALRKGQ